MDNTLVSFRRMMDQADSKMEKSIESMILSKFRFVSKDFFVFSWELGCHNLCNVYQKTIQGDSGPGIARQPFSFLLQPILGTSFFAASGSFVQPLRLGCHSSSDWDHDHSALSL
jgi:hypothetical protein